MALQHPAASAFLVKTSQQGWMAPSCDLPSRRATRQKQHTALHVPRAPPACAPEKPGVRSAISLRSMSASNFLLRACTWVVEGGEGRSSKVRHASRAKGFRVRGQDGGICESRARQPEVECVDPCGTRGQARTVHYLTHLQDVQAALLVGGVHRHLQARSGTIPVVRQRVGSAPCCLPPCPCSQLPCSPAPAPGDRSGRGAAGRYPGCRRGWWPPPR